MGKNKQAQRTKNNARPSNSSRSAELLGTSIPNFVGFSAVKDGGYVPVLPGLTLCNTNEIEMNNVDSNFQIVLKNRIRKIQQLNARLYKNLLLCVKIQKYQLWKECYHFGHDCIVP
uniref:Uncharacterized protein n=1 Tax=Apis cerana TaxID=7461 RepID=V9IM46_APICE